MTFKSACAADVQTVFLNLDEMAEAVDFHPDGGITSFLTYVAFGDPPPQLAAATVGLTDTRVASVLGFTAAILAGTQAISPFAPRLPRLGDTLVATSAENGGTWTVESITPDAEGGVVMTCSLTKQKAAGVGGSRVV